MDMKEYVIAQANTSRDWYYTLHYNSGFLFR